MSRPGREAPAAPYLIIGSVWLAGSVLMFLQGARLWSASAQGTGAGLVLAIVLGTVLFAQSVGLFFLLGFLAKGVAYLLWRDAPPPPPESEVPPVVVLYLTAGDFDPVAVDSLLRLEAHGSRRFILHDDGQDDLARRRMAEFLEGHPCRGSWELSLWHRPERRGGKAGAVNWVVERLEPHWELLLLCDSDSIALDAAALPKSAPEFRDPGTAVVQFRNSGFCEDPPGSLQRRLAMAIDVFDAFATPQSRWGYLPFFGHNAVLRLADLRAAGGLTPGFFSDDLDLSLRLTLRGRRIVYRRDISFAERHPADWRSFRKRARKWAFGCMQVVRARLGAVLTTPGIPFANRIGMLEFMGFYPAQALLLVGLLLGYLVLPWLAPAPPPSPALVASGALVALALVAPTLAWAIRQRQLAEWPAFAWSCALVYGGSVLSTARGVLDGFSARERPWIPTNLTEAGRSIPLSAWGETLLGLALFTVPWLTGGAAVQFAATYLFVSTFLFSPLTYLAYREPAPADRAERAESAPRAVVMLIALTLALATVVAGASAATASPAVAVDGARLLVDGRPFQVRGVHYSPWRAGTGPDGRSPYPARPQVDEDLARIQALGANTILIHDAPAWVMQAASEHGLHTIYAFHLSWSDTSRGAFEAQARALLGRVDSLRHAPGLLLWLLGNEIPAWVVDSVGAPETERRLRSLAASVRARDPAHLLGHGNWPPTRQLDLSFLDLACFNLYPAWPYEVAIRGYGPYLREVLVPAARGRPLLITEFGINSLEASEARQAVVLTDCWQEIDRSPTVGGIVFEWSDEWWKNFDNPVPGKGYWQRRPDPDDALRADDDPEEHYGIVYEDRRPKPALAAVERMWAPPRPRRSGWPWLVLTALALLTAWSYRGTRARRVRPGDAPVA